MWHDDKAATSLYDGSTVPVLALNANKLALVEDRSDALYPSASLSPCAGGISGKNAEMLAGFLDRAGDERFLAKTARFKADLVQMGASQVLYRGINGCPGLLAEQGALS
ncbi:MAG TPA: hypothetical protein G4O10_11095 [Dehalococcoidia bacterium]|nr:hypothetical protein [Dehalococcoidia bacterium]